MEFCIYKVTALLYVRTYLDRLLLLSFSSPSPPRLDADNRIAPVPSKQSRCACFKQEILCNPVTVIPDTDMKMDTPAVGKATRPSVAHRVKWLQDNRPMTSRRAGISRALRGRSANGPPLSALSS